MILGVHLWPNCFSVLYQMLQHCYLRVFSCTVGKPIKAEAVHMANNVFHMMPMSSPNENP